jgi:hypothetical protein
MKLTNEETAHQRLTPETLAAAVQQVKVNGYVIFENVLTAGFLQTLHDAYAALFEKYMLNPEPRPVYNHHRLDLPFRPPFNDDQVINHPLAMPVIDALLGADCVCRYFASNTCLPGSDYQPVHSDVAPLFPEAGLNPPAYHVVLNFPLVDTTEENGPMEIWPGGTHFSTIPQGEIERVAPHMYSEYVTMPAGSILIRDGRMWHRGTNNRSNNARPNIALVYTRPWMSIRNTRRIGIPKETYDRLSERSKRLFRFSAIGVPVDCELLS